VTNLTKRSDNDFSNAYWNSTANNVTAVDSVTTSPTGVASTASSITEIAGVSVTRHIHQTTGEFTPAASSPYTMSAWVKQPPTNPVRYVQLAFWVAGFGSTAYMNYDIQTGAVGTGGAGITASSIVAYPDGWYRISATATSLASPGSSGFQLGFSTTSGAVRTEAYTVVSPLKSIYLWGAQVEQVSFPTSYIPTTTSQLTRSIDLCSITGAAFTGMHNDLAGTAVVKYFFISRPTAAGRPFHIGDGTTSTNIMEIFTTNGSASSVFSGGASQYSQNFFPTNNTVVNSALAITASDAMFANNGTLSTAGNILMPVGMNRLIIGNRTDGLRPFNGHIQSLRYFKKRLANAKLQTITA
jgi:hypothetical protein